MTLRDAPAIMANPIIWEIEFIGTTFHDGNEWSNNKRKKIPKERFFYIWSTSKTNLQLIPVSDPNHRSRFSISRKQVKIIKKCGGNEAF